MTQSEGYLQVNLDIFIDNEFYTGFAADEINHNSYLNTCEGESCTERAYRELNGKAGCGSQSCPSLSLKQSPGGQLALIFFVFVCFLIKHHSIFGQLSNILMHRPG
ncbi:hypothetical protein AMECASPLE_006062 [Ameca splendens]|uniref:Uncharacterized protein n=1 Tax=Ameca splendens TaxID=208324 RepID=A0ABV1A5K6_9TELE